MKRAGIYASFVLFETGDKEVGVVDVVRFVMKIEHIVWAALAFIGKDRRHPL